MFQSALLRVKETPAVALELSLIAEPTITQRIFTSVAVGFGLKPHKTINEIYKVYSEMVEQAGLPIQQRDLQQGKQIEERLENHSFSRFLNRNPYGEVVLTWIYPAVSKVLEISTRPDVSSRATQLSLTF
jgi:hypothetical protein